MTLQGRSNTSIFESISILRKGIRSRRISSYDRTGGNLDFIKVSAGETRVLADIAGTGCIKHIWITMSSEDPVIRRNAILRMYWDNEEMPSVESPLGEFFGQGWGDEYTFISLPLAAAPSKGKALSCYFTMPFQQQARIEIENQSDKPISSFYYYIDYELHDFFADNFGRFHARWNQELTGVQPGEGEAEWGLIAPHAPNSTDDFNYCIAEITGAGHFVGLNYYIHNPGPIWYGEGDDMWLIDGEPWPGSMHGTGTEDFFNSAWCPNEIYLHPYFGYAKVPDKLGWMGKTHCYRFFIEDPIYFSKSLVASIEHGHNNCLTLDLSSVAYWYQDEPHQNYPALPGKDLRFYMPEIDLRDVHIWRHAYRQQWGGVERIWGNEWRKQNGK